MEKTERAIIEAAVGKTQPINSNSNTDIRQILNEALNSYWDSIGFIPADDVRERLYTKVVDFRTRMKKFS